MSGFTIGADRNRATLFPESRDEYVAEQSAVRVIDVLVDDVGSAKYALQHDSCRHRTTGASSWDDAEAFELRLNEPGAVESSVGEGGAAQRRAHVADESVGTRLQDVCS